MVEGRPSAKIDFGDLTDSSASRRPHISKADTDAGIKDAVEAGFLGRAEGVKIDGRTLRRTDRKAQMNFKVSAETRKRFVEASVKFTNNDEFLRHLLDLFQKG